MDRKHVILSGGGTGGHIFPAISIARKLKQVLPDVDILFVGALGKMEMEKVPQAGFQIKGLPVSAFHRRITLKNFSFIFKLLASLRIAKKILKDFKPDLVIGTGGFASGPIVKEASRKGIPCLLQEQNAFPGVTNRMLAKKVNTICVAHDGLEKYFPKEKIVLTGNPVRDDLTKPGFNRKEALEYFGFTRDRKVVFIFGGSLGSKTINTATKKHLADLMKEDVNLIWQTGKQFLHEANDCIDGQESDGAKAFDFISRMDLAYNLADIIVSRAGAISISELCLVGKPVVLVPYPFAAGDHQVKNAQALVEMDAAIMVMDNEAVDKLIYTVIELMNDQQRKLSMSANILKLARPDATAKIVEEAIRLLKIL